MRNRKIRREPQPRRQPPKEPGCPYAVPSPRWLPLYGRPSQGVPRLVEDAHPTWSHEESGDDEDDPGEDRSPEESHDAGDHKHGSDDPQDGVEVAAALRREHPESFEHVAPLHPLATI